MIHFSIFHQNQFYSYNISYSYAATLGTSLFQIYLEFCLKPTWDWLLTVMDATEAQLRFGASLTHSADSGHSSHAISSGVNSGGGEHSVAPSLASLNVLGLYADGCTQAKRVILH